MCEAAKVVSESSSLATTGEPRAFSRRLMTARATSQSAMEFLMTTAQSVKRKLEQPVALIPGEIVKKPRSSAASLILIGTYGL